MKIRREYDPEITLAEFADKHNLEMVVRRRPINSELPRYYASFDGIEIKNHRTLVSCSGDGDSEKEAIEDYGQKISEKTIVFKAYTNERREIEVPTIIEEAE